MASFHEKMDVKTYSPLNFLGIIRYPNKLTHPKWFKHALKYPRHIDLGAQHVTSFIELISNLNVVDENVCTYLERLYIERFDDCSSKEISSFSGLIKAFHKFWDHSYEEEEHIEGSMMHMLYLRFVVK